ncbi:ABC transporter permease [Mycoplasma marinum]|uniref:ABC transmembrane type-1 domain-containing protein n=1 Tax=Mycoplasma marinum TaxID=1937190 RepID=A0A4R0XUF2_9MOLU|nr:ABC transporter permease [Mycoplasma marinum]TCG11417.1 hypothetical protein C4B24_01960 [Mycoplasma marinum]
MTKYILKRLILALITLIIALTITFFLLRLINREPTAITNEISKLQSNAKHTSQKDIRELVYQKYNYHPEWNIFKAFGNYISGIFHNDFGFYYKKPLNTIPHQFAKPLKYTFLVAGTGFLFGTILGVTFGIVAGYKRGRWPDIALNIFATLFVAIPSFVLAAILVLTANKTGWPTQFLSPELAGGTWKMMKTLLLPILIITLFSFATITYYIRNEVVEVLKSDYVSTARSKGIKETDIFFRHVMRNISIPAVTIILPRFIFIIMGSLIIELFFNVPGTAHIFGTAVINYEYNIIMFSILFFASLSLLLNIMMDVLYTILDPRIKLAEKSQFSILERLKKNYKRRKYALEIRKEKGGVKNE